MLTQQDVEHALEYLDKHGLIRLSPSHNSSARWWQMHCPFHSSGNEKRPSCGCSLTTSYMNRREYPAGFFNCFACGAKYSFAKGIRSEEHTSELQSRI